MENENENENENEKSSGWDALLRVAASTGGAGLVKALLKLGADPKRQGFEGKTPLMLAAAEGCVECVRALLDASDPMATDEDGQTALMIAASGGHAECVKLLAERSNALAQDNAGWSALIHAVCNDSPESVKALLPLSDLEARDLFGWTALFHAAGDDRIECLRVLLPVSNPRDRDEQGQSILSMRLSIVEEQDSEELLWLKLLLPASELEGADGEAVDEMARRIEGAIGMRARGLIAAERDRRALAGVVSEARLAAKNANPATGDAETETKAGAGAKKASAARAAARL